jgi:hypothetical protein
MLFASCEVFIDCGDHASCEESMDHLYEENCALFIDEQQISKSDAIDGCEDDLDSAEDRDCDAEYYDVLDCLVRIDECDECSDEFEDYNDCYNNN